MGKIINTIILVNIEITINQTIIFEFENMMYLLNISIPNILCNWELWEFHLKNVHKMVKKKMFKSEIMNIYVSSWNRDRNSINRPALIEAQG